MYAKPLSEISAEISSAIFHLLPFSQFPQQNIFTVIHDNNTEIIGVQEMRFTELV